MGEVETEVTRTPGAAVLGEVRSLLEQVFVGEFTAEDWEHALGGVHVCSARTANWSATPHWWSAGCGPGG